MKERNVTLLSDLFERVGYRHSERFYKRLEAWVCFIKQLPNKPDGQIIELGSGISPKLLFALDETGFSGTLTVVDLNDRALSIQNYVASLLQPRFRLETKQEDLFTTDFSSCSVVAGNHLLDDLVAFDFAKKFGIDYAAIFSDPTRQEEFWNTVANERTTGMEAVRKFCEKLAEVPQGCCVVFNHYPSNFDDKYGLRTRTIVANNLLGSLCLMLKERDFVDLGIDPKTEEMRWLVMRKQGVKVSGSLR